MRSYFNAGDQGRAPEDVTSELRQMMDRKGPCDTGEDLLAVRSRPVRGAETQ